MIGWLKSLLKSLLPLGLYVSSVGSCVAAVCGVPIFAIAMVAFLSPLPNVWYQIHGLPLGKDILDLLVICGFIGIFTGGYVTHTARNTWLLGFYTLVTYLAVWNASFGFDLAAPITPSNAVLVGWKNYAEMIFVYFLCYYALGDEQRQKQIVYLMLVVLFLIAFRDARNFTSGITFSYDSRAEGPFWQVGLGPNHFGAFIVHFGAVALALSFFTAEKAWRWFFTATAVICIKPLFSTYSRGAWLAALAVLLAYGLLKKRSLLILMVVLGIGWQAVLPVDVIDRISMTETSEGQLESSAGDRVVLWGLAWDMFADAPVFGNGMDAFELSGVGGEFTNVHSLYLETLAEQGIIGLLFLATILVRSTLSGWNLFRKGETDFQRGVGFGFFGCCIAVLVTNLFGDRWSYFSMGVYFWILWGVVERMLASLGHVAVPEGAPNAIPRVEERRPIVLS